MKKPEDGKEHLGVGGHAWSERRCLWGQGWEEARSRPGESCKSNLYPRRWESQAILTDADVIRFAF